MYDRACIWFFSSLKRWKYFRLAEPDNVLFFALAGEGQVGYKNIDNSNDVDLYLVGRSVRPVAVTYDPVDQVSVETSHINQ